MAEDYAEKAIHLYQSAVIAGVYDPATKVMAASTISGAVSCVTLAVSSDVALAAKLDVVGDTTVTTLESSGNVDVGGTLGVDGAATFDGALTAGSLSVGATTIDSGGNTDVNGTLGVDGAAVFDGSLTAGSLSVGSTTIAATSGNTDVNGTLGVDGVATFDTDLSIGGNAVVTGNATVTGHFGCNGATAQAASSPYTQTYSTTARVVPNATAIAVATTGATNSSPYGFAQAQADAIVTNLNALIADNLALKKLIGALIDDLQAVGIAS